jgi:hypothetical protein
MSKTHALAAASFAALSILAACNSEPEVIGAPVDRQGEAMRNRPAPTPAELPPSIVASRSYRCADSSVVYIDFLSNKTASLRKSQTDTPTLLTATSDSGPYVADGYSVSANATAIQYTAPGKGEQSCRGNSQSRS